ncbi:MAG: hypothetical protein JWP97_2515 [Labilithrix sp.]|nr:hypothetical protein [Labilithrix sp.]
MTPTDARVDPPEPKLTKELDRYEILQAQLSQVLTRLTEGFKVSEDHFDKQDRTLARLADESVSTSTRLGKVELTLTEHTSRLVLVEDRAGNASMRVKTVTQSDEGQNMQIASLAVKADDLTTKLDALAGKVDTSHEVLTSIKSVLDKPLVRKIGYAAGSLLFAILTASTAYFARGSEKAAQPTIIQLAPPAQVAK